MIGSEVAPHASIGVVRLEPRALQVDADNTLELILQVEHGATPAGAELWLEGVYAGIDPATGAPTLHFLRAAPGFRASGSTGSLLAFEVSLRLPGAEFGGFLRQQEILVEVQLVARRRAWHRLGGQDEVVFATALSVAVASAEVETEAA